MPDWFGEWYGDIMVSFGKPEECTQSFDEVDSLVNNLENILPRMGFVRRYRISGNDPGEVYEKFVEPPKPKLLEARLKEDSKKEKKVREKIGLIFNGTTDEALLEEAPMAYITLMNEGFDKIYFLDNHPLSGVNVPVDDVATKESFEMIMDYLSRRLCEEDLLFCYFGGHNSRRDFLKDPAIPVWGYSKRDFDFILARDLKKSLDKIKSSVKILLFPGCYGARFASRFDYGNYIAISASDANKYSCGSQFPIYFLSAIYDKSGDSDGDGKVSIGDAFIYAMENDDYSAYGIQEPQIYYGDLNPMTTYLDV